MYNQRITYAAGAAIFFLFVLVVLTYRGDRARKFAADRSSVSVDSPEKAVEIWREKNVKGRTLLLFDNYPHLRGRMGYDGIPQLTSSNFVEISIFENIVRRIYLIIPEAAWDDFKKRKTTNPIRAVSAVDKGVYLFSVSGIPIIALTPSSLPSLSETVLVYINRRVFDPEQARELLSQKKISSDILITSQGDPL